MKRLLSCILLALALPLLSPAIWAIDINASCTAKRYNAAADNSAKAVGGIMCGAIAANGTTTLTIYDNAGGTCNTGGTQLTGAITIPTATYTPFPIAFANGLCITTGGTVDVTIFYK